MTIGEKNLDKLIQIFWSLFLSAKDRRFIANNQLIKIWQLQG